MGAGGGRRLRGVSVMPQGPGQARPFAESRVGKALYMRNKSRL